VIYVIGIGDKRQEGVDKNALRDLAERTVAGPFFLRSKTT